MIQYIYKLREKEKQNRFASVDFVLDLELLHMVATDKKIFLLT